MSRQYQTLVVGAMINDETTRTFLPLIIIVSHNNSNNTYIHVH